MITLYILLLFAAIIQHGCEGITLEWQNAQRRGLPPAQLSYNLIEYHVSDKERKTGRSIFDGTSNNIDYSNNDEDNDGNNSIEDDFDYNIENSVFASSGDLGEALRRVWEVFARKIKSIERRIKRVEQQTLDILNRHVISDCSSLPEGSPSGLYTLFLEHRGTHTVRTMCDQETEGGGWTVILNRMAHESIETATNFSRGFRDYKVGFGDPEGDFWVGLENIFTWTSFRNYQLRVQLEDFNGNTSFAHYNRFYLESERNGYKLHVSGYRGNAGDSLTNLGNSDNFTADGMMFSTYDNDRDTSHEINCSQYWDIGGWWFNRCSWANLMGPYKLPGSGEGIGINWHSWKNKEYIKSASMMIRSTYD